MIYDRDTGHTVFGENSKKSNDPLDLLAPVSPEYENRSVEKPHWVGMNVNEEKLGKLIGKVICYTITKVVCLCLMIILSLIAVYLS